MDIERFIEKGFDIFLELAARCPEFQFVSIAGQSVRDDAVEAAERLGISNVQIIDQVEDMSPLYNRAWCVLVPSFHFIETFSRVVIEAQRFGVPVIGSDRGNVPHLLTRSGVALPEVPDLWADELRRLGTDTGYWEERSARATENSKRYSRLDRPRSFSYNDRTEHYNSSKFYCFEVLKKNRIAFDNFDEAKKHINKHWKELRAWWNTENVQFARKIYLSNFYNVKADWHKEWSDYIYFSKQL